MGMDAKLSTRPWTTIALAATIIAPAAMTGCGGAQSPRAVSIALTAPTEGAVVDETRVKVFGTVQPSNATVDVAGKRVHVSNGGFARWMSLRPGRSHIRIVATAAGYLPAHIQIALTRSLRARPTHPARVAEIASEAAHGVPNPASTSAQSRYSNLLRANLLRNCEAVGRVNEAPVASCQCYVSHLEAREPESAILAWERAFLKGEATLPSWLREAALACRSA